VSAAAREVTVVDSRARFAPAALFQIWRYRELLFALTQREIKARYRQSLLGIGWAVVQPLAFMVVFGLIFTRVARLPPEGDVPYQIFAYSALVPWTFLSNALSTTTIGLVSQRSVITKTYFPREVIVLSQVGARFVDFLVASVILAGMMVWFGIAPTVWLLLVPVLLLIWTALTVGLSLITSALNVSYRDLAPVVTLGLQVWLFLSPIGYSLNQVSPEIRPYYVLNPTVGLLEAFRSAIARGRAPDWDTLLVSAAVSVVVLAVGYAYFKRAERAFADVI
jgi:lipopolysaccharide transport system permease protein